MKYSGITKRRLRDLLERRNHDFSPPPPFPLSVVRGWGGKNFFPKIYLMELHSQDQVSYELLEFYYDRGFFHDRTNDRMNPSNAN